MTDHRSSHPASDPAALRDRLRADLIDAMKVRHPAAVAALRSALGAIDNAEAIDPPAPGNAAPRGPIAGASSGVGSTEAARRVLSIDDIRALLHDQIENWIAAANAYERLHRTDAAHRLRQEAEILRRYLAT